jgi:ADP-ribose pyrophosphatase YjhB (NUDIX family)
MRGRPAPPIRTTSRDVPFTVDVVVVTPLERHFAVLCTRGGRGRDLLELPWGMPRAGESLDAVARRVACSPGVADPTWIEQVAAFTEARHPSGVSLSLCFLAVEPEGANQHTAAATEWMNSAGLSGLGSRQRAMTDAALTALRSRMDYSPIAFRLLPSLFTLGELQHVYELLLGRRIHKASFRRALHAAWLVEPADEWRSEGRGRPAQLFRYAPRKRRSHRRAVRFDLL